MRKLGYLVVLLVFFSLISCSSENEESGENGDLNKLELRNDADFSHLTEDEVQIVIEAIQRIGSVGYESETVPQNLGISQDLYERIVEHYFKVVKTRSDDDYISYGTSEGDCVAHSIYRLLKPLISLDLIKRVIWYETFGTNNVTPYFMDKIMAKFFVYEKYKPSTMGKNYENITVRGRSKGIIGILKDKSGNAHSVTVERIIAYTILEKSGYVTHYRVFFRDDQSADDDSSDKYSGLEPIENFCAFYNVTSLADYDGSL